MLIVCDIQPEYEKVFNFKMWRFAKFLNRSVGQRGFAYYFYNGGSIDACLLELLLATKALKVRYTLNKEYIYR